MRNHVKITLVCVISAVVSFAAFAVYDWSLVKDQQAEKVYYEHEAELREIERDLRDGTRDLYHRKVLTAIREGDFQKVNNIKAAKEKQEDDWKEEDFRKELISAVRQ